MIWRFNGTQKKTSANHAEQGKETMMKTTAKRSASVDVHAQYTSTTPSSPSLLSHFGLNAMPFTRELEASKRWTLPFFESTRAELRNAIEQRQSAALIAAAGTGKTTMLRVLTEEMPAARFRFHYVKVTDLSKRDFCRELAVALGCPAAGYYGSLVAKVQQRCQALFEQDSLRPVLLIDEAHDIRPDVLGILRVLTNYDMDSRLIVSIVLCGQSELLRVLHRDELESVRRRLSHVAQLRLLSRDESREYLQHRLAIVGARTPIFDELAVDTIIETAGGNLRATDCLALKSLELACQRQAKVVGAELVVLARQKVML
jgi:type II secretory pathway predicted ATPase ExeA